MIKKIALPCVSLITLLIFLLTTHPQHLPIILLVIPFVLVFITIFSFSQLVLSFFNISSKHWLLTPFIIAFVPTLLMVLGTISQLTLRDSFLAVIFGLGLLAYLRHANFVRL